MDTTHEHGRRLGHYELQGKLGSGGMGHVYQALDTKLNRAVALKILRSDTPGRIVREAQAASALNHANIVTVYEVGCENGIDFIAMECVEGDTLARLIEKRLSPRPALRYAIQIADALGAAHAAGIVHSDLKPNNIMVTEGGAVKVLDFGIAKMTGVANRESAVTETITQTVSVAGTFAYMSPEQAEGKELDGRSDIFAFGCVLYEMFTGQRAFYEDSSMRTLAAVMAKEPKPARELSPDLPRPLDRIIENCLRKRRQERWQSVLDVKILLEMALADLDAVPPPPRKRRIIALALLPVAAVAGASLAWFFSRPAPAPAASNRALSRVTTSPGLSAYPALSRDGNLLAFASDSEAGNLDVWLQQIGSRDPIRLTTDPADDTDPMISPDNARIVFRSERKGGGIYTVPVLGGEPVLVVPKGRNPRFSPDGRWIAYWEGRESRALLSGSARVWVMDSGGGEPRQLGADLAAVHSPVWAPDSSGVIALGRANNDTLPDWWILPLNGAHAVKRPTMAALDERGLGLRTAWLRRPVPLEWRFTGVLFTSGTGDAGNLWEVPMPSGPAVPVTHGPGYHMQASASLGGRLAFSDLEWKQDVWSLPVDADRGVKRGDLQRLTADEPDAVSPTISADGAYLAFRASELGRTLVRVRELATGKRISLVASTNRIQNPRLGGGSVAYSDGDGNIFTVPSTGGPGTQLCKGCGTVMGISSDGRRVTYEPGEKEHLMFLDVPGKKVVIAAERPADGVLTSGKFSPDGRWMAFHAGTRQATAQVFIIPVDGAMPVPRERWIEITDGASEDLEPAWSPNGNLLYFLSDRDGFRCIWARALNPATKTPSAEAFGVAHFHTARRSLRRILATTGSSGLSLAPGRLIFAFGELTGNIWLEEKR